MLARFRVLLPFSLSVRQSDSMPPEEFDLDGCHVSVHAPYQAATSISVLADPAVVPSDVVYALHPAEPPLVDPTVNIDGQPTVSANAIRIDVVKPDIDCASGTNDPRLEMLFDA